MKRFATNFRLLAPALVVAMLAVSGLARADEWRYETDIDKMTNKERKFASIESDNALSLPFPYQDSDNKGTIMVRNHGTTDVLVHVRKGQILCPGYGDGCQVKVKFDDAKPITFRAIGPADHSSTAFFISDSGRFIAHATKAKRILVQFTMYQAGMQTLEFSPGTPLVWGAVAKKKK